MNQVDNEDEDVVFQESALYNYFEEIGIHSSNFECALRNEKPNIADAGNKNYFHSLIYNIKSKLGKQFQWLKSLLSESRTNRLEKQALHEYIKLILERNHLIEEDAHYLTNWMKSSDSQLSPVINYDKKNIISINFSLFVVLTAAVERCCCYFPSIKPILWTAFITYGTILSLVFVKEAAYHWMKYNFQKKHTANTKFLNKFLDNCCQLNSVMFKSLNFIQELEVVARGFTLFLPSTPISKLERITSSLHSSHQQCPGLRSTVNYYSEENFFNFREATKILLNSYHLSDGIDHPSHYLATVPLEEFSSVFKSKETDDSVVLPIGLIKSSWSLSRLQMSEYFRRLGLTFVPELQKKPIVTNLISLLSPIHYQIKTILEKTEQSYNFHKISAISYPTSQMKKPSSLETMNHFHSLQIAVHSLALHLQSSLNKVMAMETLLENTNLNLNMETGSKNKIDDDLYHSLHNNLQSIKMEMEACVSCYDESIQQLEGNYENKTQENKICSPFNKEDGCVAGKNSSNIPKEPIPLFDMGDPIAEDQVFEAVVTDEENFISNCEDNSDYFVLEKNKYNRENSKRMLKELKSVLVVKADEWKKREKAALAKLKDFQELHDMNEEEETEDLSESKFLDSDSDSEMASLVNEVKICDSLLSQEDIDSAYSEMQPSEEASVIETNEIIDQENKDKIEHRLQQFSQASNLGFLANVAAMAASRSRFYNSCNSETFADETEESYGFSDEDN